MTLTEVAGKPRRRYHADPCWPTDARSPVFTLDRETPSALFHYDLVTGPAAQTIDLQESGLHGQLEFHKTVRFVVQ